jgi:hypothetical protein
MYPLAKLRVDWDSGELRPSKWTRSALDTFAGVTASIFPMDRQWPARNLNLCNSKFSGGLALAALFLPGMSLYAADRAGGPAP